MHVHVHVHVYSEKTYMYMYKCTCARLELCVYPGVRVISRVCVQNFERAKR